MHDSIAPKLKKDKRTLLYYCAVPIRGTRRHRWICLGERSYERALEIVQTTGLDRLLLLHRANALTSEAVQLVTAGQVTTCTEAYYQWLDWFKPTRAKGTTDAYCQELKALFRFAGLGEPPLAALTEQVIRDFVNEAKCKFQTRCKRLAAVRSLMKFASARGLVMGNPSLLVQVNTRDMSVEMLETKHYQPIPDGSYHRLLAAARTVPMKAYWPIHDWIVLSYCTGLRLSDCVDFEWASIKDDHLAIYPLKGRKNGRKRLAVPLSDPLIGQSEMLELIARLKSEVREDARHVWPLAQVEFTCFSHARLHVQTAIRKVFDAAGLPEHSFHSLRTTFARRLEAAGKTLEQIAARMSHSSVETTKIYLGTANGQTRTPAGTDWSWARPAIAGPVSASPSPEPTVGSYG